MILKEKQEFRGTLKMNKWAHELWVSRMYPFTERDSAAAARHWIFLL